MRSVVRRASWHVAAAGFVFALALPAAAQDTPGSRVLVMPFTAAVEPGAPGGAGAALWLGEAASILLVEKLEQLGVGAMPRDQRQAAFDRLNLPLTPALTRATTIRVADLIGASEVVFGEVRLGEQLEVRARAVRLASGRELAAIERVGPLDQIFELFDDVAEQLAAQTGRLRPSRPAEPPLPLETFESYVKGLVAATPEARQRFLEAAVRQAPADSRILMALWATYSAQGEHERALASANAVAPETGAYRRARFAVALSLVDLRRYDGAWQALTALHDSARSAAVSSLLGVVQLRRGSASAGETPELYFRRAVGEAPEHTDYLFNLGYAYARAGRVTEGLTWMREVVRFDAADGDAHLVMGALLTMTGRLTEAQRELDLARLLGGTRGPAPAVLSAEVPEDFERVPALADFADVTVPRTLIAAPAQQDQAATALFHLRAARSLIEAGRDRDAIAELRRAIYLSPYEEEPHRLLGGAYQRAGRLSEAIEAYTVSIWCRETVAGRVALGQALLETGERDAAAREAARALQLDPSSAEARALTDRIAP